MAQTAVQFGTYLNYFAFENAVKSCLTEFDSTDMQMDMISIPQDEFFCEGPSRRTIVLRYLDGNLICFRMTRSETSQLSGLQALPPHLTLATLDMEKIVGFYQEKLRFKLVGRVLHVKGVLLTAFITPNHEYHSLACFKSDRQGVDHYLCEMGEWNLICGWFDYCGFWY